ncbi:hypothetical protein EDC94DRAFT_644529 [Helicostylum pulchrum]|nr:hypothetical protein EDC94DRAFT_644529 [Helicostylum pulchrum]
MINERQSCLLLRRFGFKIANENNAEYRNKSYDISQRRPDGQFKKRNNEDSMITVGYMEAKAEARNSGKEVCMLDFVRLGVFGKNAVDFYKLQGTLLVQAIGPCLTFYLLQKKIHMSKTIELDASEAKKCA